jgi:hypothetical protein
MEVEHLTELEHESVENFKKMTRSVLFPWY